MPEELATPEEVAKYLRTTVGELANRRYQGTGPRFIKRGRKVLYSWADVKEWVAGNTFVRTDGATE